MQTNASTRPSSPKIFFKPLPKSRVTFAAEPAKSPFKNLFIGTGIGRALKRMSLQGEIPKGLKDQECERGGVWASSQTPVRYVPEVDPVADRTIRDSKTLKVTLPNSNKTEYRIPVWSGGTNEDFLIHVNEALSAIEKLELYSRFEQAQQAFEANATDIRFAKQATRRKASSATPESADDPEATTAPQVPVTTPTATMTASAPPQSLLELELEKADLRKALVRAGKAFFSTYEMMLADHPKQVWDKIVKEQTESALYTDIQGVEQDKKAGKTPDSFKECIMFHLQSVFKYDAAEQLRTYLSFVVRKPARVKVRQFVQRVQQLNGYLSQLPCKYYSAHKSDTTEVVKPFDDAELAELVLRMCPDRWQSDYMLHERVSPKSMRALLAVLELIETRLSLEKPKENPRVIRHRRRRRGR